MSDQPGYDSPWKDILERFFFDFVGFFFPHRSISFGIFSSDMSNHLKTEDNFNFFRLLNKGLKFSKLR
jgi:hypothetical protein